MATEAELAVQQAEQEVANAQGEADRLKIETLRTIADGIPARVDELAKGYALKNPEAIRALGKEGVSEMRNELGREALALAERFATASDKISWPEPTNKYHLVRTSDIHSAIFKTFYGRMNDLISVLHKRGLLAESGAELAGAIVPQALYRQASFESLAVALNSLGNAKAELKEANAAFDKESVESLWD
ncbi:hypothetical protein [Leucobacter sp. 7(1)]|uniref:hypothetical protein n=1 Tax=Leucobacter sp. 7(1) TaxID=1255613 RepID=UPI000B34B2A2|nr:hypothetical protein [Leucobacter sp. 7(1)]